MTDYIDGLIPMLKREYPNEWSELPEIRELIVKWDNYVSEFLTTKLLPKFPFSDNEKEYLQSSLLDGLYEIRWVPILAERRRQSREDDLKDNFFSLRTVCGKGYLLTAQFLYSVWKNECLFHYQYMGSAFEYACIDGQLQVAQWLVSIYTFNKETLKYTAISSSQTAQFEVVKWLCTLIDANSTVVDISMGSTNLYNVLFARACSRGCLELARWLLAEYPKIHIFSSYARGLTDHRDAFTYAYYNGHTEVVEWLWSLRGTHS